MLSCYTLVRLCLRPLVVFPLLWIWAPAESAADLRPGPGTGPILPPCPPAPSARPRTLIVNTEAPCLLSCLFVDIPCDCGVSAHTHTHCWMVSCVCMFLYYWWRDTMRHFQPLRWTGASINTHFGVLQMHFNEILTSHECGERKPSVPSCWTGSVDYTAKNTLKVDCTRSMLVKNCSVLSALDGNNWEIYNRHFLCPGIDSIIN